MYTTDPDRIALCRFLTEAKRNTYATQQGQVASCRPDSHDLAYGSGDWRYLDSYFGSLDFSGEEIVHCKGVPVWSMNYYGYMLDDSPQEGFIETLREALTMLPEDFPCRGPAVHNRGSYSYFMEQSGDVLKFKGSEWIEFAGRRVYELQFHGGRIR